MTKEEMHFYNVSEKSRRENEAVGKPNNNGITIIDHVVFFRFPTSDKDKKKRDRN